MRNNQAPEQLLGENANEISERALHVDNFLRESPDIVRLRDEIAYWRALSNRSAEQRRLLTARAADLQGQIALLDQEQVRWQATWDQIHDTHGIEAVAARVQHELEAIRNVRSQTQDMLNRALNLQNQTSQTARQISDSLSKLTEAEDGFRSHIFDRDGEALWAPGALRNAGHPAAQIFHRAADQNFATAGEFIRGHGGALLFLPILYGITLLATFRLRIYMRAAERPEVPSEAVEIFSRPYSISLLVVLVASIPLLDSAPVSIAVLRYLLWIHLVFRLTPVLVAPDFRPLIYLLLVLNFSEALRVGLPLLPGQNRLLLTCILLGALVAFAWMTRPLQFRKLRLAKRAVRLLHWAIRMGLLLLSIALLANVFGYVSLSYALGMGTLLSAFSAAAVYFVARVIFLLIVVFLNSQWASPLSSDLREKAEVWCGRILLIVFALLWWLHSQLYLLLFRDSFKELISSVLDFSVGIGKARVTVGGALGVILIFAVGYALAKGASSLLRSVLVARFPLSRGLPYAISKVTFYCLMLLVFAAAITAAGADLNKFTIITGALGVGVGFGLQNIVSNFASGLILLLERPIRVEDTIEVSGLVGTVRRIGARSSTITTAQGAEVIVPNSNLLSNNVVNWTLSSPWRRVEIPVGVAYGSDPEGVIRLLVSVASSYPDVMIDPPPAAFFLGFGESALSFELRFWSARQDTWFQLKSDVAIGVAQALREANIEVPFPQRDLHLRSIDSAVQQSLAPNSHADNSAASNYQNQRNVERETNETHPAVELRK
jgi:small-conductance mechanosensitive channel